MTYDVKELLSSINPALLDYQQWVNVGMALKDEGGRVEDWDAWSRSDAARYHPGECEKKWRTFNGASSAPVTLGTVVQYAREQGWKPTYQGTDVAYDWDDVISRDDETIIDPNWLESRELPKPSTNADDVQEIITYLETLFAPEETVGYVTNSYQKDGRWIPSNTGGYDRTAGELAAQLRRYGDVGSALGDYNREAGAWIRFNPLDGKGVKNENVTDFRYALVESDAMEIEKQYALLHELELPIAMIVHSGRKSLHAIVKIDAPDYAEYRKRVDYLYKICEKNGLQPDTQNRNPSRLSRMPGVLRGENRQYIVEMQTGKASWTEWKDWIEAANDDLPEPENMADAWDNLPPLAPPLIDGVLRMGHKMLIAGPSKAGKSFSLIELCIAIAEGGRWLGWQCAQGRVMYVNLELDRASCLHRFKDVYEAMGYRPEHLSAIDIWNLRGKAIPMDALAPKLIRRAAKKGYTAIIIDPIYKVITGDENSADQMALFCNQFDKVCTELGCAVIYCHHHSKGAQAGKRSMDRASGSGVFARDPDAMIDMMELDVTDELRKQEGDKAECAAYAQAFERFLGKAWENEVSQDDQCSAARMRELCQQLLTRAQECEIAPEIAAKRQKATKRTAWRIEGTLREFAPFTPVNVWFDYPIHKGDISGALGDLKTDGEAAGGGNWKKAGREKAISNRKTEQADNWQKIENAFESLNTDGRASITSLMDLTGITRNSIKKWVDHQTGFERDSKGIVSRVKVTEPWGCQGVSTGENDT